MRTFITRRRAGGALCLAVAIGAAAGPGAAPAQAPAPAPITANAVGEIRLGASYARLRRAGLIGKIRPGCELGGPGTRSARLRAPLAGDVDFSRTPPRKVVTISVSRGAAARGVGIGASLADIRAAFGSVRVERGTEETFGITLVEVPRRSGGPIDFAIDTATAQVSTIAIPSIAFCE